MPMFYFRWNVNAIARFHFNCFLAFFLIVSTTCYAYKNLSTTIFCVMNMPVISATRFKCYIKDSNLVC